MNPKMTLEDAAQTLGRSKAWVYAELQDRGLQLFGQDNYLYFQHETAAKLFPYQNPSATFVFQILKGGTGKTSLAFEFAVCASLFGAKVVCIDLDQQGNLTQALNQNAEETPVMIDILAEGYGILDSLVNVIPGIDLLPSRIENALLDEILRLKKYPLEKVYRDLFKPLKQFYDVIIVDCPPSLGQSVASAALSADHLISPVTPDKFALSGLNATCKSINELEEAFRITIPHHIVLNKFEENSPRSLETLEWLSNHSQYQNKLLDCKIRLTSDFPEAALKVDSIFETLEETIAKSDINAFTQTLLASKLLQKEPKKKREYFFF